MKNLLHIIYLFHKSKFKKYINNVNGFNKIKNKKYKPTIKQSTYEQNGLIHIIESKM